MAKEIIERFSDDIDGSEATHTGVSFSFEGTEWSIDLSESNYTELSPPLSASRITPLVFRARVVAVVVLPAPARCLAVRKKDELTAIRSWAEAHSIPVAARGRIKESIIHAYHQNDPSLVGG